MQFKLNDEIRTKVAALTSALADYTQEARDEFDEQPEQWRESEAGEATDGWLENLGELLDALEAVTDSPEEY